MSKLTLLSIVETKRRLTEYLTHFNFQMIQLLEVVAKSKPFSESVCETNQKTHWFNTHLKVICFCLPNDDEYEMCVFKNRILNN